MKTTEIDDSGNGPWYGEGYRVASVAIQNDGKIIVGGIKYYQDRYSASAYPIIERYNTDGSYDSTFSKIGVHEYHNFESWTSLIKLKSDGKIILMCNSFKSVRRDPMDYAEEEPFGFLIARLNANGNFDSTFGSNGIVSSVADEVVQIQSINVVTNKLYAVGYGKSVSNFGFSARFLLTDNKPPIVSIITPSNNTIYAAPATVTVTAIASDGDGIISNVKFYNGTILLKAVLTAPYTYTLSNLPKGTYTLTAKATDNSGLQTTSKPVTITVLPPSTNKAPVVNITSPANNAVYFAPATFTINASASDPDGTIKSVKFYRGGILLKTDSISPYSYTFSNLSAGTYLIVAVATDNKGLISSSSSLSIGVSVPLNKVPVVRITNPINNVVYPAKATINISAIATDADGSIARVKFYRAGTLLGVDSISPYTYTMTNVAPGSYSLVAKATDNKGLVGSSASIAVQVNRPPVVSITSPINNTSFTAPATITVRAAATYTDGSIANVMFYRGTTFLKTVLVSPYTYVLPSLPAGTYSITARATDNMGAQTISAPVTIKVSNPAIVSSKPMYERNDTSLSERVSVKLAPNPARSILNIYTSGFKQNQPQTITLISSTGVILKTMQLNVSNKNVQLDVSSFVSGVYTIKVISGDKVVNKQFLKL